MLKPLSLAALAQQYGGEARNAKNIFNRISIDTRTIEPGDLFIALSGQRFDAHDYLQEAIDKGASGLVVHREGSDKISETNDIDLWLVENTTQALGHVGHYQRTHYSQPLVAITGSSGKTTVKGMLHEICIAAVGDDAVYASKGNFNNHIGVPLSLLELNEEHRYAVIEMGASAVGEIAYLTELARPTVAVVNNVMAAHIEGFGSVDAIAQAKGEIYQGLDDEGVAIVNGNDVYAAQWLHQNRMRKTISFYTDLNETVESPDCYDVKAQDLQTKPSGCCEFSLSYGDQSVPVQLSVLGRHNVANATAAAACALALGVELESIRQGLQNFRGEPGRMQVHKGKDDRVVLIDDSYNANPGSMKAAIDVLSVLPGKTLLVMGDMAELGEASVQEHRMIGAYALEKKLHDLFALGADSQFACAEFTNNHGSHVAKHYSNIEALNNQLHDYVNDCVKKGDRCVILVKGSRSSRMERVVHALQSTGGGSNASLVS